MRENNSKYLHKIIKIDEGKIKDHLGNLVKKSVEDTLNAMLDAEADQLCNAHRYERTESRKYTRPDIMKEVFIPQLVR